MALLAAVGIRMGIDGVVLGTREELLAHRALVDRVLVAFEGLLLSEAVVAQVARVVALIGVALGVLLEVPLRAARLAASGKLALERLALASDAVYLLHDKTKTIEDPTNERS